MSRVHLQDELAQSVERVIVQTQYGPIKGGRAVNGAAAFLEVPYALPPARFENAKPLPKGFVYEDKEYIYESSYGVQPTNDGQAASAPYEDKVGLGKPTENPLFVNIICPPSFPAKRAFPVKVYIHGGFLQFGSPHGLGGQAQFVAAEQSEVWVNVGYRLSAFGFLASDQPKLNGNFGFQDQWLALLWVRENIQTFGGKYKQPRRHTDQRIVCRYIEILHHASRLPEGEKAPFHSAILQSNSIVIAPKTPTELRPQFQALCCALKLDPDAPDLLATLRDPEQVPWSVITHAIETDAVGIEHGTFRGCMDDVWMSSAPEPMEWQRSGGFARALQARGVRCIVVGDLTEEWYLYSIAHPVTSMRDVELNMERYYQIDVVKKMMTKYREVPAGSSEEEFKRLFGEMLSEGQVHLPVRLLARDLMAAGFPVIRYEIGWTPEQVRPFGYVTHGTDRPLWTIRRPTLEPSQVDVARAWVDRIESEVKAVLDGKSSSKDLHEVLALNGNKTISWKKDDKWDDLMRLVDALPGETA
ncbi:hypothetical protein SCP_1402770 [Sparassis crispa]|uniref:Carboxylesterase type B domain-containing protein n=1 Tax=Sparassis crispa TaxID=139825 RepID=A0A401H3A0_9APHY|nr:hypothetical protein SCP_1402770 [Sparassis crispa]GBE88869.1 hypothetical protein SCP_1402770 [Sparassis crispa]